MLENTSLTISNIIEINLNHWNYIDNFDIYMYVCVCINGREANSALPFQD